MLDPVTLPPGRAKPTTRPAATGSAAAAMTMGIVFVAVFTACMAGVEVTTTTVTLRRSNSAASLGSLSCFPSAYLYSMAMFSPTM
jgi:hypothetical protein